MVLSKILMLMVGLGLPVLDGIGTKYILDGLACLFLG